MEHSNESAASRFFMSYAQGFPETPAFCLALASATGLLCASEYWALACWVGLIFLLVVLRQPLRNAVLAFLLGIGFYGYHHREREIWKQGSEVCARFPLSVTTVDLTNAKVLSVRNATKGGYLYRTAVSRQGASVRGTEGRIPAGSKLLLFSRERLYAGDRFTGVFSLNTEPCPAPLLGGTTEYVGMGVLSEFKLLSRNPVIQWSGETRERILSHAHKVLLEGVEPLLLTHELIPSLLFGSPLSDPSLLEPFKELGAMHLFVVSGLHLGLILTFIWGLLYFSPFSTRYVLALSLVGAWCYAGLTGFHAPVARSALAVTLYLMGFLCQKRPLALNSLMCAFVLLLLWNPYALYSVGVLLSFGVVCSLLLFARFSKSMAQKLSGKEHLVPRSLARAKRQGWNINFRQKGGVLVCSTVVAWLASSVIMALTFNKVYVMGLISTILLVPLVFSVIVIGSTAVILGSVHLPLAVPFNTLNEALMERTYAAVAGMAEKACYVWHMRDDRYEDKLTVFALESGGMCLYLGTSKGVMMDTGYYDEAEFQIKPALDGCGAPVGTLLLSHDDTAHTGGAEAYPTADVYQPHKMVMPLSEDEWTVSPLFLSTDKSARRDDQMVFYRITRGEVTILYISDAGYPLFRKAVELGVDLRADILITSEHRHGESCLADFLAATGAESVILGRTLFYQEERVLRHTRTYDQRFCGEVTVSVSAGGYRVQSER